MAGDRQVVLLDREGVGVQAAGEAGRRDDRVAVVVRQDGQPQLLVGATVGWVPGRCPWAEQDVLAGAEQQHGTGRGPAREIADVGGAGDQGGRGSGGGEPVPQQPASDGVHL